MTVASHYVFKDLDEMIKHRRYAKLEEINRKYYSRYTHDKELAGVCGTIANLIASESYDELDTVSGDIKELIILRKIQTNDGRKLWFKKRR